MLSCGEETNRSAKAQLHIALDFDDTFTADTVLWRLIITAIQSRNHRVYIVTCRGRGDIDFIQEETGLPKGRIYCTGGTAKKWFMAQTDVAIDIWIDDSPEMILNGV